MRGRWLACAVGVAGGLLLLAAATARPAAAQQAEADVLVAQAILAHDDGRHEEALQALTRALELVPEHLDALYYSGVVLAALGRLEDGASMLERARAQAPTDEAVLLQLGGVYVALGRDAEASQLLEPLHAARPELENLGYYVGVLRYRQGEYQAALRALQAGVARDPRIQQLTRFYAGLTLERLGLSSRAAAEIETARRLLPVSPLTGPAERLREAVVAAREGERRFGVELRLGGVYDDNVPVNPEPSPDPLVQELREREQESAGELVGLRLDYTLVRQGGFDATGTYSLFAAFYNELSDFNLVAHLLGLRGAYRDTVRAVPYQAVLQYAFEHLTLGGDAFVTRHTVSPSLTILPSPRHLTVLQAGIQTRNFADDARIAPEDRRDGVNWSAGLTHVFRFAGDRHWIRLGYQVDLDDADGRNFGYLGHRVLAGFQYTFPWRELRATYDVDVHVRDYRERHTTLPTAAPGTVERSDTETTHLLGLWLPLPWRLTLGATFQATSARSNLDVFTFDRRVGSLLLIWTY